MVRNSTSIIYDDTFSQDIHTRLGLAGDWRDTQKKLNEAAEIYLRLKSEQEKARPHGEIKKACLKFKKLVVNPKKIKKAMEIWNFIISDPIAKRYMSSNSTKDISNIDDIQEKLKCIENLEYFLALAEMEITFNPEDDPNPFPKGYQSLEDLKSKKDLEKWRKKRSLKRIYFGSSQNFSLIMWLKEMKSIFANGDITFTQGAYEGNIFTSQCPDLLEEILHKIDSTISAHNIGNCMSNLSK